MSKINYVIGNKNDIELTGSLWLKLNEIHYEKSTYFKDMYKSRPFSERKSDLLEKSKRGKLAVILAKTEEDTIGYCISSVTDNVGEIESICIDEKYRHQGIGNNLMEKSLDWIKSFNPKKIIVKVSVGNEEVLPFYKNHGFYPRLMELQIK